MHIDSEQAEKARAHHVGFFDIFANQGIRVVNKT
nr:MAG TPA: hypothetical protein [Caudoviricetes sp.]